MQIENIDLSWPLLVEVFEAVKRARPEILVVLFRDRDITPEQQIAFGQKIGDLYTHPAAPHETAIWH